MSDNVVYTGQLFIREASSSYQRPAGRRLVIVAGVIEVDESFPLEGEAQYVTLGRPTLLETSNSYEDAVQLTLFRRFAKTLDDWSNKDPYYKHLKGLSIDGSLLSPIWRT